MIASAEMTLRYLGIHTGARIFLCLNPDFIAGKMMLVRALTGNLDLFAVNPVSNPLLDPLLDYNFDLASFVPYQIDDILKQKLSIANFKKIKNVLIGGAGLPVGLQETLKVFPNNIYHTFGMTETVSHIALRKITAPGPSDYYETLQRIKIDTDERGCLRVKGPITEGRTITTNDLIKLIDSRRFEWRGRIDQVVNSGGFTIYIPELERRMESIFRKNKWVFQFFLTGQSDSKLGQKLILVVESLEKEIDTKSIKNILTNSLSRYEVPKKIYFVSRFSRTATGKVDKQAITDTLSS